MPIKSERPWFEYDDHGVKYNCTYGDESFEISNETFSLYGNYPKEPGYWEKSWKRGWIWHPEAEITKND